MPLSPEITERLLREGDLVALLFQSTKNIPTFYYLRVTQVERPNNLPDFSLGTAAALNTAGTSWDAIQDSSNNYYLEPDTENYLYQVYWGASPSYIWVYRRFPSGVDQGSLVGTRSIGDRVGFITGAFSPINRPSVETEFYTVRGIRPEFFGYHPYAEPSSPTVFLGFYVSVYTVARIEEESLTIAEKIRARQITMGGSKRLQRVPSWLGG